MEESKIVLFIVEGKSDEMSLAPALEQIVTNKIKFKVMCCDITSHNDSNVGNIEKRIKTEAVENFLKNNRQFRSKDICKIVHIIDTDGAFAPDNCIVKNDKIDNVHYYANRIECKSYTYNKILVSRERKRKILSHLSTLDTIKIPNGVEVPYEIYYMSCNLDCVLHDKRNSTTKEKISNSRKFSDEYDDPKKFIEFFNSDLIKVDGSYVSTWDNLKLEFNSLSRGSNFWIFINKYKF